MVVVGRLDVKRPLGRTRSRWEDNIKMDFQGAGWGTKNWTKLAQNRGKWLGTCKCGNEPSCSIKCTGSVDQLRN